MGYSKEHVAATRQRILHKANQLFRANGYANTSIDQIMEAANLTRGGFYAHFKSKEDLFAHAMEVDLNFTESLRSVFNDNRMGVSRESVAASLKYYLARENMHRVGSACTMVTLTPEIARMKPAARDRFTESLKKLITEFDHGLQDEATSIHCLVTAVGALTLARAVTDPELADTLLKHGTELAVSLAMDNPST